MQRMSAKHATPNRKQPMCRAPRAFLVALLAALVGLPLAAIICRAAGDRVATTTDVPAHVRVDVRGDGVSRTVEGSVVVEAVDGGLLLELADERYELLQPGMIAARTDEPTPTAAESAAELGRRLLAELPAGFALHTTRHYVVCFDTSRDYAKWCAALFERLHEAFGNFWSKAGLEVHDPARPLVVVIFADRAAYEAHAARDLGPAANRVVGYYNLMSNRVTTCDLTGLAAQRRPGTSAGTGVEILANPAASDLVSTLVHEATHQMAFNCGMHRRLAPVPLWVSEGIATYFETPDLQNNRGWRGIGMVNRPRMERFLQVHRAGDLQAIVASDEPFRSAEGAVDAYAAAWVLVRHLLETRRTAFIDYLRVVAAKRPLAEDSPRQRLAEFEAAFGAAPDKLEDAVVKALARLATKRP
ncbi:MAG: DUF1570 domain-containing protein [Planctomycetota bacterium]|nr:MAG: DUF1570 domain-containing protein [Planctomycetota bacterium]